MFSQLLPRYAVTSVITRLKSTFQNKCSVCEGGALYTVTAVRNMDDDYLHDEIMNVCHVGGGPEVSRRGPAHLHCRPHHARLTPSPPPPPHLLRDQANPTLTLSPSLNLILVWLLTENKQHYNVSDTGVNQDSAPQTGLLPSILLRLLETKHNLHFDILGG